MNLSHEEIAAEWLVLEPRIRQVSKFESLPEELHEDVLGQCRVMLPKLVAKFQPGRNGTLQSYLIRTAMCVITGAHYKWRREKKMLADPLLFDALYYEHEPATPVEA